MVEGVQDADAVFFLGYHARTGDSDAVGNERSAVSASQRSRGNGRGIGSPFAASAAPAAHPTAPASAPSQNSAAHPRKRIARRMAVSTTRGHPLQPILVVSAHGPNTMMSAVKNRHAKRIAL